eukprot:30855-Pelagococcus_subviridis.AAC.2
MRGSFATRYSRKSTYPVTSVPAAVRLFGNNRGNTQHGTTANGLFIASAASTIASVAWSGCIPTKTSHSANPAAETSSGPKNSRATCRNEAPPPPLNVDATTSSLPAAIAISSARLAASSPISVCVSTLARCLDRLASVSASATVAQFSLRRHASCAASPTPRAAPRFLKHRSVARCFGDIPTRAGSTRTTSRP